MTGAEQASYTAACAMGLAHSTLADREEACCVRHLIDSAGDDSVLVAAVRRVEQLELANAATRARAVDLLRAARRQLARDRRDRDGLARSGSA